MRESLEVTDGTAVGNCEARSDEGSSINPVWRHSLDADYPLMDPIRRKILKAGAAATAMAAGGAVAPAPRRACS